MIIINRYTIVIIILHALKNNKLSCCILNQTKYRINIYPLYNKIFNEFIVYFVQRGDFMRREIIKTLLFLTLIVVCSRPMVFATDTAVDMNSSIENCY